MTITDPCSENDATAPDEHKANDSTRLENSLSLGCLTVILLSAGLCFYFWDQINDVLIKSLKTPKRNIAQPSDRVEYKQVRSPTDLPQTRPSVESNLANMAAGLEQLGWNAVKAGNMEIAIDHLDKAVVMYAKVADTEKKRAGCLQGIGQTLAIMGKHKEAVVKLKEAVSLLELVDNGSRSYHSCCAALHREEKMLDMLRQYQKSQSAGHANQRKVVSGGLRTQVFIAGKALLSDYQFRKSFLMDNLTPVSFPRQVQESLDLEDMELVALCVYSYRVHSHYWKKQMKEQSGLRSVTFRLSPACLKLMSDDSISSKNTADRIEEILGLESSDE